MTQINEPTSAEIVAAWDRLPTPAERAANAQRQATLAGGAVASDLVLGLGESTHKHNPAERLSSLFGGTVVTGSSTALEEWMPEDRAEPGEPHAYTGEVRDADRYVESDDELDGKAIVRGWD